MSDEWAHTPQPPGLEPAALPVSAPAPSAPAPSASASASPLSAPASCAPAPRPGRISSQVKLVASGIPMRARVDVYDDVLAITCPLLPRGWRLTVQIALFTAVMIALVDLLLVRPLWSPEFFAVAAAALLCFLVVVLVSGVPARIVTLVVPLAQVRCQSPAATVRSVGGKAKIVTLFGPFGGDWSTEGRIKLVFRHEAGAKEFVGGLAGVRPTTSPYEPGLMR